MNQLSSRLSGLAVASLLSLNLLVATRAKAATAFPGAEGFGANATGGNSGDVARVTNLNDAGTGSFREAVGQPNRKVAFAVSGVINLRSPVGIASNVTVDGTTAPAPGITLVGQPVSVSKATNIIIRNLRFREDLTGPARKCSLQGTECSNVIVDHCSVEWGRWDCLNFTHNTHDVTVQYCIIGESLVPQRFGSLFDGVDRLSVHHNLYIDNQSRNPKLKANAQYVSNVIYNWGGAGGLVGGHSAAAWKADIINNYFIAGPSSSSHWLNMCKPSDTWYVSGNFKDMNRDGKLDGTAVPPSEFTEATVTVVPTITHRPDVPVTLDTAVRTLELAVSGAYGCQPNDEVDKRLIGYVKSYGKAGQIGKPGDPQTPSDEHGEKDEE